jgi:hypothetical protein
MRNIFDDDDEITSDGGAFQGYSSEEKREMRAKGEYPLDDYKPAGLPTGCTIIAVVYIGIFLMLIVAAFLVLPNK